MKETMQSIYTIIDDYNETHTSINEIFYLNALEEDTLTSVDDDSNKMAFSEKLRIQVEKLFKTIEGIIEKCALKITNFIGNLLQTDTGFKDHCRKAMVENKPLEAVKLIAYQYNDSVLDSEMNNMTNIILGKINSIKTSYQEESDVKTVNDMDRHESELITKIFEELKCPKEVNNINSYFMYIKDKYRTAKKEQLFTAKESKTYYAITQEYNKINDVVKSKQQILKNQKSVMQANLNNIIRNKMTQNHIKQRALNQYKNVTHLYNLYTHFLEIYAQLRIEKILSYRAVLKKIYHFDS